MLVTLRLPFQSEIRRTVEEFTLPAVGAGRRAIAVRSLYVRMPLLQLLQWFPRLEVAVRRLCERAQGPERMQPLVREL